MLYYKHYFLILITLCFLVFQDLSYAEGKKTIYIYNDEGVSNQSLIHTMVTLKGLLSKRYKVTTINATQIQHKSWVQNAALLVIPGGADLPYVDRLNGKGNSIIKGYIKDGGSFLGICAGAYYASSHVEFDKTGKLEVTGDRELKFFPGKAIGPVFQPFDYKTSKGSRAVQVDIDIQAFNKQTLPLFYNGGGYFENADHFNNTRIIGTYKNKFPAIIKINYGKGKVLLSGVHFEYNPFLLKESDLNLKQDLIKLKTYNDQRVKLLQMLLYIIGIH